MVEGWIEKTLGELFDFSGGLSKSRADLSDSGYPYLHYGDIHGTNLPYVDEANPNNPRLKIDVNKVTTSSLLKDGDVVFVDASEDDEGTSRYVVVRNKDNKPFISGLHTIVAKSKTDELDNQFREFCFQTQHIKDQFKHYAVGTKVTGISKNNIGKIILHFPTDKSEQSAIANILSDIDEYILSLERLITKKKAIKQGAMQNLLTGKTRLKGFKGEWVEKKLGEVGEITMGQSPNSDGYNNERQGLPLVQGNADIENRETIIRFYTKQITKQANECDIILTVRAPVGNVARVKFNCCLGRGVCSIKGNDFLYHLLVFIEPNWSNLSNGSTFDSINSAELSNVKLFLPYNLAEQTAIATILSDMDAEIEALQAKLNKAKQVKQGAMQQLLTGKTRLNIDNQTQSEQKQKKANVPFKRSVWAAEIADRLCNEPTFGHVKMEKLIFLTENMCEVDLGSNYHRDAAGPYDNRAIRSIDNQLKKQNWFEVVRKDKRYCYIPLPKRGGHKKYFDNYYSDVLPLFDKVINTFRRADTERCEIVATLYSAWKDLENTTQQYTDNDIINEVINNWNETKKRIPEDRWQKALDWMRKNGFAPIKT